MSLFFGIFDSFPGFSKICQMPHKGRETRKRKNDSFDVCDSELAVQPGQKRKRCSDLHFGSDVMPSIGTNSYHINTILGWLSEDDITCIVIFGMGGIGKTTLAKQVHQWVLSHDIPSANAVAWVSVGMHFTISHLQSTIAKQVGFDLQDDQDEIRRAALLHTLLSRAGNPMIILDDLWDSFRLELVGIPKHCKLVITSRSLEVSRRMGCQKVLKIEPLPEEEAWQIFSSTVGYASLEMVELRQIAKLICHKCAGVPLAITTLAKSMSGVIDASLWKQALNKLDIFYSGPPNVEDIFFSLELSYANLNNVTLQKCFLYCALYPKDCIIDREKLIHLWIGEMLIDDVLSLQPQYDKGHSMMNKLLNSSLLEASEDKMGVKMHELIRDVAIAVAGKSFMVKPGMRLIEVPKWQEDLHVVSLMMNSISDIPLDASPRCPKLSTLLLHHNPIQTIPDSFFLNMRGLRVLNMSYTHIKTLASSVSDLEELRVLDVSCCQQLMHVPSLEKLQKLQFLDLSSTAIGQIPHCLEKLKMLRELNLSCIPTLKKFPNGILPALSTLKRLECNVVGTASELQSLTSLEILDARFADLSELSSYVRSQHWRALECFHLQVGHNIWPKQQCSRGVSLNGCSLTSKEGDCFMLPDNIQELYVDDCRGFSSVSDLMNSVNARDSNCVPMTNHKKEFGFKLQAGAFSSLEICTIRRCHDVESLFTAAWTQNLQGLGVIEIEDCLQLKELIAEVGRDSYSLGTSAVSLPQLKRLKLTLLPQLNSIYRGLVVCASLQSLTFLDCPKLNRLPFSFYMDDEREVTLPALEWIEGQEEWWELLDWDIPESKSLLKPMFRCRSSIYTCQKS